MTAILADAQSMARRRKPAQSEDLKEPSEKTRPLTNVQLATRALHRRATEARSDMTKFYNFVIKHETTKLPLKAAPHQCVQFSFVEQHPHCVIRQPIGTGKTFGMAAIGLYYLGRDATQRGAIVSKAQGQAAKVLHMVSDYIIDPQLSAPLALVFPELRKSVRPGEAWTQTAITVDRPAGIRDASLIAVGLDGQIQGARLSWVVGDDILDSDNTFTVTGREQTHQRFDARIISRLDPQGSRAVVTNTPWHLEDLTYRLEQIGWPTLSMDIYGNIWFSGNVKTSWIESTGLLRPSKMRPDCWRLVQHDPDPDERVPLWPERYSLDIIESIKVSRLPHEFARQFLCIPFDETALRCQREWLLAARRAGRGWLGQVVRDIIAKRLPTYTGVDLGVGAKREHDLTCFFTFAVLDDGRRVLLDIESGHWDGPSIVEKVIEKYERFDSIVAVESNTAQDYLRQFVKERCPGIRIKAHTTSASNKHNLDFGVESVFTELQAGKWIVPCDENMGGVSRDVEIWENKCVYYQPPPAHTSDHLMACWIAKECSRRGGGGRDPKPLAGSTIQMASGGGF